MWTSSREVHNLNLNFKIVQANISVKNSQLATESVNWIRQLNQLIGNCVRQLDWTVVIALMTIISSLIPARPLIAINAANRSTMTDIPLFWVNSNRFFTILTGFDRQTDANFGHCCQHEMSLRERPTYIHWYMAQVTGCLLCLWCHMIYVSKSLRCVI